MKLSTSEKVKNVIEIYDDIAEDYSREFHKSDKYSEEIIAFLDKLDGKKVLDVGCGDGRDCKLIIEKGYSPTGVDVSESFLKIARRKIPRGKFEKVGLTDLPYDENSFDGILANCSLQHIPTELLSETFEGFSRVLKPNGKLLIFVPQGNGEGLIDEPYRPGKKIFTNFLQIETLEKLLKKSNFSIIKSGMLKSTSENEFGDCDIAVIANNDLQKQK